MPASAPWMERFLTKFDIADSGCWEWTGAKYVNGYGAFRFEGKTQRAHRVVFSETVEPIPDGLVIDHLCRNRACVNPDHLEVVTHRENSLRGDMRTVNAARNRAKTHCKQGHEYTPENTGWRESDNARLCRTCSREWSRQWRARRNV